MRTVESLAILAFFASATVAILALPSTLTPLLATSELLFLAGFTVLNRKGFAVHWRRELVVLSTDEIAIFLGLVTLPVAWVAPLVTVSAAAAQVWARRDRLKATFNVAQFTLAAAVAAVATFGVTSAGAPLLVAAVAGVFAYAIASNLLLAGVLTATDGESFGSIFLRRVVPLGLVSATAGVSIGLAGVALWRLTPIAVLALAPVLLAARRYSILIERADRELSLHRRLAAMTRDLMGTSDLDTVGRCAVDACGALFAAGRARLALATGDPFLDREWVADFPGGTTPSALLAEKILDQRGRTIGTLQVFASASAAETFKEEDATLLRLVASQTSAAIENVRAIADALGTRRELETYLDAAGDAIFIAGPRGDLRYANATARRLFGLGDGPIETHRAADLIDASFADDLASDEGLRLDETVGHDTKTGHEFPAEASLIPVTLTNGDIGRIAIVRDVREERALARARLAVKDRLREVSRLKTSFINASAHELRTPLTALGIQLHILAAKTAGPLTPEQTRALAVATRNFERLSILVREISEVAKLDAGDTSFALHDVEIGDLLDDAFRSTGIVSTDERARVTRHTPDPLIVNVDRDRLARAMGTFLAHAMRATARGERVDVLLEREDEHAIVRIFGAADPQSPRPPGTGEDLDDLDALGTPTGTGLDVSLWVSRRVIERHGGRVRREEGPGPGGITFTISLPLASAQARTPLPDVEHSEHDEAPTSGETLGERR